MTSVQINPIYSQIFDSSRQPEELRSNEQELREGPAEVDFSMTEKDWTDTAKTVALVLLKIVLFPWGIYEGVRWCIQRLIMAAVYPAQSWIVKKCFIPQFQTQSLDEDRAALAANTQMIIRHVTLERDGTRSSGLMIASPETLTNGKWVLQATGNIGTAEHNAADFAHEYRKRGFNLLMVNNPGVGRSEGMATPESIGICQDTAIEYLKIALKAEKIVLAGYSIGGAAIGQAVLQHDFTDDKDKFLVVNQVTFSRTSDVAQIHAPKCLQWCAKSLVRWSGCEMDNVEASKKLNALGIPEIVIQAGADEIIPTEVSLSHALNSEGIVSSYGTDTSNARFLNSLGIAYSYERDFILPDADHLSSTQIVHFTLGRILHWELETLLNSSDWEEESLPSTQVAQ